MESVKLEYSLDKNRENSPIDKARRPEELKKVRLANQSDKDRCTDVVNYHRKEIKIKQGCSERV